MAQIEKRVGRDDKVHWRARVRLKGGAKQSETFARKTDAVLWAQQMEAAIRAGRTFHGTEAPARTPRARALPFRGRACAAPRRLPIEQRPGCSIRSCSWPSGQVAGKVSCSACAGGTSTYSADLPWFTRRRTTSAVAWFWQAES